MPVFPLHSIGGDQCTCGNLICEHPGKHPRTVNGFKAATTNVDKLKSRWKKWPDANIGIATGGEAGILVIDVDPRHGGNESLAALESELSNCVQW